MSTVTRPPRTLAERAASLIAVTGSPEAVPASADESPVFTITDVQLLRGYATFFRTERLEHPRLLELESIADRVEQMVQR